MSGYQDRAYHSDFRNIAWAERRYMNGVEFNKHQMVLTIHRDAGEIDECEECPHGETGEGCDECRRLCISLPAKLEACGVCGGRGTHVNPSIDAHGITESERERDWDDESWEGYMGGAYDVPCYSCKGEKVIPVPDEAACSEEQIRIYRSIVEMARSLAEEDAYNARYGY
jgi:hypothetical protein